MFGDDVALRREEEAEGLEFGYCFDVSGATYQEKVTSGRKKS